VAAGGGHLDNAGCGTRQRLVTTAYILDELLSSGLPRLAERHRSVYSLVDTRYGCDAPPGT
jgi:hypothetical protein